MLGIGIDIIEIDRIKRAIEKQSGFLDKLFTEYEQNYYINKGEKAETIAGFFAAKEAVSKVLGTGVRYSWKDIEIKHTEFGAPFVVLHGQAKSIADEAEIGKVLVSISHCKTYAVANAAGVKGDEDVK
ncbi:holo-ACP synthase [Acidaminobacter sp. JC074]|uniref:holo-ACP synthase n=1 Tax=Acidaminobacter sp. JC074 TaxID=2530199 RepID=UPI001F0F1CC1|nr:holo-ACP synthase [Acidaminobacter sp. JC074]